MKEFSPEWFDESSRQWRLNKKRYGEAWKYICEAKGCKKSVKLGENKCVSHASTPLLVAYSCLSNKKHSMILRSSKLKK
jgi:hypothetical protein